uniref:Uncharacterized protein n=1 Tax=Pelusios castaneus TaxID=367368 RepID=A0A8C8S1Q9_9SAUR
MLQRKAKNQSIIKLHCPPKFPDDGLFNACEIHLGTFPYLYTYMILQDTCYHNSNVEHVMSIPKTPYLTCFALDHTQLYCKGEEERYTDHIKRVDWRLAWGDHFPPFLRTSDGY